MEVSDSNLGGNNLTEAFRIFSQRLQENDQGPLPSPSRY